MPWSTRRRNRLKACCGFAAAKDLGLPAIPGRQVGQGTPALGFVFNPCGSPGVGRQCWVTALAGLDRGLVVARDGKVFRYERWLQDRMASAASHFPIVVPEISA